jgi:acyl-CoA synthetase (AMP-forming)/AMP-acid ligase II
MDGSRIAVARRTRTPFCTPRLLRPRARRLSIAMFGASPISNCAIATAGWPLLTNGYFNSPDASEQLWTGGYLHTGDIGMIAPGGDLRVIDRIKDVIKEVIKTGGEWISSLQLEGVITRIAGVAECAVIGVQDERWGERPLTLVVRDPMTTPPVSEEDIKAHVLSYSKKGKISKFAVPQKILFVEALAKTSAGKFGLVAAREKAGAVKAERFNTNPSKPVDGRMREHCRLRKAAELIKRISGVRVT